MRKHLLVDDFGSFCLILVGESKGLEKEESCVRVICFEVLLVV